MYRYKVRENILITKNVRLITLVPFDVSTTYMLYRSGQYAAISLHDKKRPTTTRCFSLVSSPTRGGELQFSIRVKGKYTHALERLKPGDRVDVRGPYGNFVFNEYDEGDLVFFAGGIGIAPFIGMLRYAIDVQAKRNIHLIYSNRNIEDIAFLDKIKHLEHKYPYLKVTHVLSRDTGNYKINSHVIQGIIDESTIDRLGLFTSQNVRYMLCGPPPYMNSLFRLLQSRGVKKNAIQSESFSQGPEQQTDKLIHWPFNAYAISGLVFLLSGGIIIASDLNKTLPKLEGDYVPATVDEEETIPTQEKKLFSKIHSIPPQVDMNLAQEPIYEYIENDEVIVVSEPAPKPERKTVVVASPKKTSVTPQKNTQPTPTTKPTPTVVPKEPTRSTVS